MDSSPIPGRHTTNAHPSPAINGFLSNIERRVKAVVNISSNFLVSQFIHYRLVCACLHLSVSPLLRSTTTSSLSVLKFSVFNFISLSRSFSFVFMMIENVT